MNIRRRYFLTGSGIIVALVLLVFSVRFGRDVGAFSNLENAKVKGPHGAPVQVVVYSDFQCPACKNALPVLQELENEFSETMQIEFRHYPLERPHRWAMTAATFAECAAEQGKFWEYHDRLYLDQATWSNTDDAISLFARYSHELGLDKEKIQKCLENPETLQRIRRERSTGVWQKVESTPTIFINGQLIVGGLQLKTKGREIVLEELKKLGKV
ncbi:MAG: thioredoxin domain-containing protein [Candidatus Omnitrophica bacterium]|nr:thioredoxin domain-containing protein [Candidatus Omnitrophota bacterium]